MKRAWAKLKEWAAAAWEWLKSAWRWLKDLPRRLYTWVIRGLFKACYDHYLPRDFIDRYVDSKGDMKMSPRQMLDCNPQASIADSAGFQSELSALQARGGGTKHIKVSGPAGALTNGTLGNFTVHWEGDLTVRPDGTWSFNGDADFYDEWDFDPKPFATGGRSTIGEIKTRAAAYLLPGTPFKITSDKIRVNQSDADDQTQYTDFPGFTPTSVIDPCTAKAAPDIQQGERDKSAAKSG